VSGISCITPTAPALDNRSRVSAGLCLDDCVYQFAFLLRTRRPNDLHQRRTSAGWAKLQVPAMATEINHFMQPLRPWPLRRQRLVSILQSRPPPTLESVFSRRRLTPSSVSRETANRTSRISHRISAFAQQLQRSDELNDFVDRRRFTSCNAQACASPTACAFNSSGASTVRISRISVSFRTSGCSILLYRLRRRSGSPKPAFLIRGHHTNGIVLAFTVPSFGT